MSGRVRKIIDIPTGQLEVVIGGSIRPGVPAICASHPADVYGEGTVDLLRNAANSRVVCVNPRGLGRFSASPALPAHTFASMVEDLEAVRRSLGIERWVFWGISGGGWLGQAYAAHYPEALQGLVLESSDACFRKRLADPSCIVSPFHQSWRPTLEAHGLIARASHAHVGDPVATEWCDVAGVGAVFRRRNGPALLVSSLPISAEMRAAMPLLWTADFRASLPKIRTPTLVIGGDSDPIVPLPHLRSLREAIAGSTLLVVDGAGHAPTASHPRDVAGGVRAFLAG